MRYAIGMDVGGTKTTVGLITHDGKTETQVKLATSPQEGFAAAIQRYSRAIGELLASRGLKAGDLAGIGIGCPGPLNPFTGVINNDYTLPTWGGCNIVKALGHELNISVRLENDADAALVGEAYAGAGRGAGNLVMLTFGTGVGGAVLNDGIIYRGAGGEHPEIGHVPVDPGGPACYCGLNGCLESLASGTAIGLAGKRAGFADPEEVFAKAAIRDARALRIIARARRACEVATWTIIHTLLPQRIILGGGIMEQHYQLFEPAMSAVIPNAKMGPSGGMEIRKAELGNDAGLVGAGMLAHRRNELAKEL